MNYLEIAEEVLQIEANGLHNVAKNLNDSFTKAIELISKCQGKLIITGVGKSGLVGTKIAATMSSTGTSSFFLHPTDAMHGDLGMIGAQDIVLGISYSGESSELLQILPHLKRFKVPLIAMAKDSQSTLAQYSDIFLNINVEKEACPLEIAPTTSTTATMALGDALAVCLMKKRKFQKEDFASFHPGGSLGKQLFIKAETLLQKKNLPIVPCGTLLKDALIIMNQCRLGSAIIINDRKQVVGLLSDGDLRRYMLKKNFNFEVEVETIATLNPKTTQDKELLAVDALQIIEKNKIQMLIIVNENNTIYGVLHIHKLIEAGIR